jgi:aspartyl-tRNA(Asn)/glutamyl-tRNA(Gln) amidotransferase subunit C
MIPTLPEGIAPLMFEKQDLNELKTLCRIALTPEEEEEVLANMKRIVEYVELLEDADVDDLPPTTHILGDLVHNVTRADEVKSILSREAFLQNAPDQIGGMIRIPPVFSERE